MEDKNEKIITTHLPNLLRLTKCGDIFLSWFKSKNIFDDDELEKIRADGRNYGDISKSSRFYQILQTKSGSFIVLLEALRETNQTGVLALLGKIQKPNLPKRATFSKQPNFVAEFLKHKSQNVLIVNAIDCKISCARICETVENSKYLTFETFLEAFSAQDFCKDSSQHIPVVYCENEENIHYVISFHQQYQKKIIIVGKDINQANFSDHTIVNDKIGWNDLSRLNQYTILQKLESSFDLCRSDCLPEIENLEQDVILQLIRGDVPKLFNDIIPEPIRYYIPRRMVTRNIISSTIFAHLGPDIFLVTGIRSYELSRLAGGKSTSTSSDVIQQGCANTMKYIVLDEKSHLEKIVKLVPDRPVHLLNFEEGQLTWLKSTDNIAAVQQDIGMTQTTYNEEEFVQNILSLSSSNKQPICISDTPGMGKSVLLSHIARFQQESMPGSVVFLVFNELVESMKEFRNHPNLNYNLIHVVQTYLCNNMLGKIYLQRNNHIISDVFLDGFDEINSSYVQFAYELLKSFPKIFPNTRIWITTRPHMLTELEKFFNVLGYNIQEFQEVDQINFLTSFWSSEDTHSTEKEKLAQFAAQCLTAIKLKLISDTMSDVAGIPLQCLFIGEIFKRQADDICRKDQSILTDFKINSMSDLYQQLVIEKFWNFYYQGDRQNVEITDLIKAHFLYAIWILFPAQRKIFAEELGSTKISNDDIYRIGIIESKTATSYPRFIHRSLAEFFLALYIIESACNDWSKQKSELFFNHILETKPIYLSVNRNTFYSQEFIHSIICNFVDSLLSQMVNDKIGIVDDFLRADKLQKISEACATGGFEDIFIKVFYPTTCQFKTVYSEKFLVVCTLSAGLTMVSKVYRSFKKLKRIPLTQIRFIQTKQYSLLHFAVIRGCRSIVEQLINGEGFMVLISDRNKDVSNLIHECIFETSSQTSRVILEKVEIVKYLSTICPSLLTTRDGNGNPPLLSSGIHVDLVKEILSTSRTMNVAASLKTFLYISLKSYSCTNYYGILKHIREEKGSNYFVNLMTAVFEGTSLFREIFHVMEPDEQLLELLKGSGVKFTQFYANEKEHSILNIAVNNQRRRVCIAWLLRNSCYTEKELTDVFIQSVVSENLDSVVEFLDGNYVDANIVTSDKNNLLHLLLYQKGKYDLLNYQIAQTLVQHGVPVEAKNDQGEDALDLLMRTIWLENPDWLQLFDLFVAQTHHGLDIQFLRAKFLINRGYKVFLMNNINTEKHYFKMIYNIVSELSNVNLRDKQGNTLLHFACRSSIPNLDRLPRSLLSLGANPLLSNDLGFTPICEMLKQNSRDHKRCLDFIMDMFKHLQQTTDIYNIIIQIVKNGKLNIVKTVCEWYATNFNKPVPSIRGDYNGENVTILDMSFLSCDGDVLEYLIDTHGCRDSLQHFHNTCIHKCVLKRYANESSLKFMSLVSRLYPDLVNTPDENGFIPLSLKIRDPKFVKHLVRLGSNIKAIDTGGNTPLHWALKNNSFPYAVVEAIVECGADVNAETAKHETPLILSLNTDKLEIVKVFDFLITKNANPGKRDINGDTVLHLLARTDFYYLNVFEKIVTVLLDNGHVELLDLPNNNNITPFQIAVQRYNPEDNVFKVIKEYKKANKRWFPF